MYLDLIVCYIGAELKYFYFYHPENNTKELVFHEVIQAIEIVILLQKWRPFTRYDVGYTE